MHSQQPRCRETEPRFGIVLHDCLAVLQQRQSGFTTYPLGLVKMGERLSFPQPMTTLVKEAKLREKASRVVEPETRIKIGF